MKVVKIGGGCLRRASHVLDINSVLHNLLKSNEQIILVVSALGKTTSMLEEMVRLKLYSIKKFSKSKEILNEVKSFHLEIIRKLFSDDKKIFFELLNMFENFEDIFKSIPQNIGSGDLKFILDQILPFGETISSEIVSQALKKFSPNLPVKLLDAREFIVTNNNYGNANVSIPRTCIESIPKIRDTFREDVRVVITQGFIGRNLQGFSTTLGREGSDYTASLLANFLEAKEFIKYTNVKGVMTEDPAINSLAKLIPELSYQEFRELQDAEVIGKLLHP